MLTDHEASYPDPIRLEAGDPVRLSGRSEHWDGHRWLWAEGPDGRAGWVPDDLVVEVAGATRAARRYSAAEMSCRTGEAVEVLAETHGWAWCRNGAGREGWVPIRALGPAGPAGDG